MVFRNTIRALLTLPECFLFCTTISNWFRFSFKLLASLTEFLGWHFGLVMEQQVWKNCYSKLFYPNLNLSFKLQGDKLIRIEYPNRTHQDQIWSRADINVDPETWYFAKLGWLTENSKFGKKKKSLFQFGLRNTFEPLNLRLKFWFKLLTLLEQNKSTLPYSKPTFNNKTVHEM